MNETANNPAESRILVVDDEKPNRELLRRILESQGYGVETAADAIEALAKLELDIDLILLDVNMPGIDGFEVTRRIRARPDVQDIPIIIITAMSGKRERLLAVEAGANDFVGKPFELTEIKLRIAAQLKFKLMSDSLKNSESQLREKVEARTTALRKALEEKVEAERGAHEAHHDTVRKLAVAAEYKDEDTGVHIRRMSTFAGMLASSLLLQPSEIALIERASVLHDVGKIGIPDRVLLKPGKLDPDEWEIMKTHTLIGARILANSPSALLQAGEMIAITHHEKWDGSGYPGGLKGAGIPLAGRLCAVVDVFDALTSERPYKKAFPNDRAFGIIEEERGRHFDPDIADNFLRLRGEIEKTQRAYNNPPGSPNGARNGA